MKSSLKKTIAILTTGLLFAESALALPNTIRIGASTKRKFVKVSTPAGNQVNAACFRSRSGYKVVLGRIERNRFTANERRLRRKHGVAALASMKAQARVTCASASAVPTNQASPQSGTPNQERPTQERPNQERPNQGGSTTQPPANSGGGSTSRPLTPAVSPTVIPQYAQWEAQMKQFGQTHCNLLKNAGASFDVKLNATYYDAQWVYQKIADHTGDASWMSCADAAEKVYRDAYVVRANGGIPGYWNFSHGITQDFLRTGDATSKNAALALSTNAAYAVDGTSVASTVHSDYSREVAYTIMAYHNAEILGQAPRGRLNTLVEQAYGHMDQWFVSKNAPYVRPFMVALTSQALISHYEKTGDARVIPTLTMAWDYLWTNTWVPSAGAFKYTDREHSTGGQTPAADLNLLVAPVFGWLYHQTGEVRFRDRGDQIFAGGVTGAYLTNPKQFNQSYRWSFEYVKWRTAATRR